MPSAPPCQPAHAHASYSTADDIASHAARARRRESALPPSTAEKGTTDGPVAPKPVGCWCEERMQALRHCTACIVSVSFWRTPRESRPHCVLAMLTSTSIGAHNVAPFWRHLLCLLRIMPMAIVRHVKHVEML